MPPQADCMWQRNIQVNYSTWSKYGHSETIRTGILFLLLTFGTSSFCHAVYTSSDGGKGFGSKGESFTYDAKPIASRKDDRLPSSLRASKRGDVESICFPVNFSRAMIVPFFPFHSLVLSVSYHMPMSAAQVSFSLLSFGWIKDCQLRLSTATSSLCQEFKRGSRTNV